MYGIPFLTNFHKLTDLCLDQLETNEKFIRSTLRGGIQPFKSTPTLNVPSEPTFNRSLKRGSVEERINDFKSPDLDVSSPNFAVVHSFYIVLAYFLY